MGQIDSASKSVLYSIVRDAQPTERIVYSDKVGKEVIQGLKKYLGGATIKGQIPSNKTIYLKLDKNDRDIIRNKLNCFPSLVWEDNLFPNSERIPYDSVLSNISNRVHEISIKVRSAIERGDTAMVRQLNMSFRFKINVFTFTAPIFIKNGEIALIFYIRLCGPLCGIDSLAAYKLENGRYKKWLRILEGEY